MWCTKALRVQQPQKAVDRSTAREKGRQQGTKSPRVHYQRGPRMRCTKATVKGLPRANAQRATDRH